jgi:hypothetical protein
MSTTLLETVTDWMKFQARKHDHLGDPDRYAEQLVNEMSQYDFLVAISEALEEVKPPVAIPPPVYHVTADEVKLLREVSGEGVIACKKALEAHPWNFEAAIEHLRCMGQAVVRGPGALQPCGCPV